MSDKSSNNSLALPFLPFVQGVLCFHHYLFLLGVLGVLVHPTSQSRNFVSLLALFWLAIFFHCSYHSLFLLVVLGFLVPLDFLVCPMYIVDWCTSHVWLTLFIAYWYS